jgi:hypothetical protein
MKNREEVQSKTLSNNNSYKNTEQQKGEKDKQHIKIHVSYQLLM